MSLAAPVFITLRSVTLQIKEKKKKKYKDQDQIFYNSALTSCILDCTKLGKKEKRGRNVTCYSTNDTSLLIFPGNFIRSDLQSYFKNPNKQTVPSTISLQFHPFDSREIKLQSGKSCDFDCCFQMGFEGFLIY